ncbi:MAG: hypothetical protein RRA94_08465 [Bacteroidota bacterium]|nr:hypothetical protein [Bacteroidota bacterium]
MKRLLLPFLLFSLFPLCLHAQLSVSPSWLYLDARRPAASLELRSSLAESASYDVTVRDRGQGSGAASCRDWLRIDPKHLHLTPQSVETLYVAADMPAGVGDGEYVAELLFLRDDASGGEEVVVPVHVRVGEVYSDVKLAGAGAERKDGEVVFRFNLTQMGNAAYRGNLVLRLEDGKGREVHAQEGPVDVYGSGVEELVLPSADVPPGRYRVFMHFDSDRKDLGTRAIPVLSKKYTIDISMP